MSWFSLDSTETLDDLLVPSNEEKKLTLIFKHTTRCPISVMALNRIESNWNLNDYIQPYFLDLIRYRTVSNEVSDKLNIIHESPQVIVLEDGKAIYSRSHNAIQIEELRKLVAQYMQLS